MLLFDEIAGMYGHTSSVLVDLIVSLVCILEIRRLTPYKSALVTVSVVTTYMYQGSEPHHTILLPLSDQ